MIVLPLTPIVWLLVSLGYFKLPAHKACPIGLALSLAIAILFWQMDALLALKATLEGAAFAVIPILPLRHIFSSRTRLNHVLVFPLRKPIHKKGAA